MIKTNGAAEKGGDKMQVAIIDNRTFLSGTPEEILLYIKLAELSGQITIKPRLKEIEIDVKEIIEQYLKQNRNGG